MITIRRHVYCEILEVTKQNVCQISKTEVKKQLWISSLFN